MRGLRPGLLRQENRMVGAGGGAAAATALRRRQRPIIGGPNIVGLRPDACLCLSHRPWGALTVKGHVTATIKLILVTIRSTTFVNTHTT